VAALQGALLNRLDQAVHHPFSTGALRLTDHETLVEAAPRSTHLVLIVGTSAAVRLMGWMAKDKPEEGIQRETDTQGNAPVLRAVGRAYRFHHPEVAHRLVGTHHLWSQRGDQSWLTLQNQSEVCSMILARDPYRSKGDALSHSAINEYVVHAHTLQVSMQNRQPRV